MASVRFHILVINVDVVQLLLLLENLLRGALINDESMLKYKGDYFNRLTTIVVKLSITMQ